MIQANIFLKIKQQGLSLKLIVLHLIMIIIITKIFIILWMLITSTMNKCMANQWILRSLTSLTMFALSG